MVDLDLNPLLVKVDDTIRMGKRTEKARNEVQASLDAEIQTDASSFLYDKAGQAQQIINHSSLVSCPIAVPHWKKKLHELVSEHVRETGSVLGTRILNNWEVEGEKFLQICPKEMLARIPVQITEFETQLIA